MNLYVSGGRNSSPESNEPFILNNTAANPPNSCMKLLIISFPLSKSKKYPSFQESMTWKLMDSLIEQSGPECQIQYRYLDNNDLNLVDSVEQSWAWCDKIILVMTPILCSIWLENYDVTSDAQTRDIDPQTRHVDLQTKHVLQFILRKKLSDMLRFRGTYFSRRDVHVVNFQQDASYINDVVNKWGVDIGVLHTLTRLDEQDVSFIKFQQTLFNS